MRACADVLDGLLVGSVVFEHAFSAFSAVVHARWPLSSVGLPSALIVLLLE